MRKKQHKHNSRRYSNKYSRFHYFALSLNKLCSLASLCIRLLSWGGGGGGGVEAIFIIHQLYANAAIQIKGTTSGINPPPYTVMNMYIIAYHSISQGLIQLAYHSTSCDLLLLTTLPSANQVFRIWSDDGALNRVMYTKVCIKLLVHTFQSTNE